MKHRALRIITGGESCAFCSPRTKQLTEEGYSADSCRNGMDALDAMLTVEYDGAISRTRNGVTIWELPPIIKLTGVTHSMAAGEKREAGDLLVVDTHYVLSHRPESPQASASGPLSREITLNESNPVVLR